MEGLNTQADVERPSIMQQMEHLQSELNEASDALNVLEARLMPIIPPAKPACELGGVACGGKEQTEYSSLMESATSMTGRVRHLTRHIKRLTEEVQL